MAEDVNVVDPDSGDGYNYDSLYDWEAGEQANIDVSNTIAVAKCRSTGGTADTTAVIIDGWTTSATDYIKIWTDTSESYRHNGTWQTGNKYRFEWTPSGGTQYGIDILEPYVRIFGIQFKEISAYGSNVCVWARATEVYIKDCLLLGSLSDVSDGRAVGLAQNTINVYLINNIFLDWINSTYDCRGVRISSALSSINLAIYNCTFSNCQLGISLGSATGRKIINNIFTGNTADVVGTCAAGSGYNATTNAAIGYTVTGGATADRVSQTFSFVGAADFHLQSSDEGALSYGLNLYNDASYPFQDDIDGQDRGGAAASWDIGADEFVVTIEQEGFRFRNDDGSETTATWKDSQDATITLAAATQTRLRLILNATGDPDGINAQLEARYKPSGGAFGPWDKVY